MFNKSGFKLLFFLLLMNFIFLNEVSAQFWTPCVDTIRQPNPYHPCDYVYDPVCGCDGVTYRNDCSAYWHGAINYNEPGICGDIEIDIVSNLVRDYLDFSVYLRLAGSVNIMIFDVYGMMYYNDYFPNFIGLRKKQIPVQNLRHGVYFIVVFANGVPVTRKFVRAPDY